MLLDLNLAGFVVTSLGTLIGGCGVFLAVKYRPRRIPTRLALVQQWVRNAKAAKKSIIAISFTVGTAPDSTSRQRQKEEAAWAQYLEVLKEKKCANKEFVIRILAPRRADRIPGLYARRCAGAQIRVSPKIDCYDFRFQICDEETIVLNVPSAENPNMSSNGGSEFSARSLAALCIKKFNDEWNDTQSQDFDEFVCNMMLSSIPHGQHTGPSSDELCMNSGLPRSICLEYLGILSAAGKVVCNEGRYYRTSTP